MRNTLPFGRRSMLLGAGALVMGISPDVVTAQSQDRPLKLVVPFAPGGVVDVVARAVAPRLQERIGRPVIVENRAGAGGAIGAEYVASAQPDGNTILVSPSSIAAHVPLSKKPKYDPRTSFAHVTMAIRSPYMIVVHPEVPARSLAELVAYAKAHPGQLNFGTSGVGGGGHLVTELFQSMAGIKMTHIPFKGTAPAMQALLAGQTQVGIDPILSYKPHVDAGKLRALAVTAVRRVPELPDTPAATESVRGYDPAFWIGFSAPAATPPAVVARLAAELVPVIRSPQFQAQMAPFAAEPVGSSPEEFTRFVASEVDRWTSVVRAAAVEPLD